ncbi:ENTH domain-containing protein [Bisporella sp. PMI_857]|nr:ENTH domain-containing protein [Bisporella sp. PMI_857]KAH8600417.1 ENTH domain-containing protein [Bisporella sp. PMI_857]
MSKVIRSVKNVTKGYSSVQVKVRNATSNDPWGPTGTEMSEIAQMTYSAGAEFAEIMDMIDKRLNDKGKNWRHVLKALKVLDYCLHEGSESVVTWARKNIYIIKTLREFQYQDEDGRDVGNNVRVSAKELTSLILDEDRLRAERSDRKTWKQRVQGLDDSEQPHERPRRERERPHRAQRADEEDAEYKLAIEASKYQEEEDRKKRQSRGGEPEDDDLAKALKLSREEEELRRRELEEQNVISLFDDDPIQTAQPTGFNQGYQQQPAVDWSGNPQQQQQQQQQFQPQSTGYNPYAQQSPGSFLQQPEPIIPQNTNNPWATSNASAMAMKPTPTGSNNPFASSFSRPSSTPAKPTLSTLAEQQTATNFNNTPSAFSPISPQQQAQPQKEMNPHEARLNALLASGDGMDTFGNTGNLRIPAQHTAPGTFVNSAGAGLGRIHEQQTGTNPFLHNQYTGMPQTSYGQGSHQIPAATGPAGMSNGYGFGAQQQSNNPFGQRPQQGQGGGQDLIQF